MRSLLQWLLSRLPRQRRLRELRARWGKVGSKDGWLAGRYFELHPPDAPLDDKTWRDLEMPRIFTDLDTTVTPLGSQHLYRLLRSSGERGGSESFEAGRLLLKDAAMREAIQLRLTRLTADSSARIAELLFGAPPEGLRGSRLLLTWSGLSLLVLLGVALFGWPLQLVIAVIVSNGAIILLLPGARPYKHILTLRRCHDLLRVADKLATLRPRVPLAQITALKAGVASRRWARRRIWLLDRFQEEPWCNLLNALNFLFLAEIVVYIAAVSRFEGIRSELIAAYEQVGSLDAVTAVASLMARVPAHCAPAVTQGRQLEIEEGCHPLLTRPVSNSLTLRGRSALITGSNMTGKTTFLKMIATNIILGRTLGVCLAKRAVIPSGAVKASIHGEHSIESGESKYFAEVQAMLRFLASARSGGSPVVVVIDEPFSGTNTIERVAAAKAVLAALSADALVLAATHDGELQPMLAGSFDPYHFSESPEVEGFFDYRLCAGSTRQTNALRLLAALGLPQEIVADAQALAATLGREVPGPAVGGAAS